MATATETAARLEQYVKDYSAAVWPDLECPVPDADDMEFMEYRADGYANAHVEGECPCGESPQVCGEKAAAAEFVETN